MLLILPLFLVSCNDSDDKELDKALIGTWYLKEYKADLDVSPNEAIVPIENYIVGDYEPITLEFKSNGDIIMTDIKEHETDKAKVWTKGDVLYMKSEGVTFAVQYSIKGDVLETREDMKADVIEDLKYIFRKNSIPEDLKINKAVRISTFEPI